MEGGSNIIQTAALAILLAAGICLASSVARAELGESDVPETTVVPSDEGTPPPAPKRVTPPPAPRKSAAARKEAKETPAPHFEVEPANALLRLTKDTPVLVEPSRSSKQIEMARADKLIQVTGSTHYFLRVSLKSGQTGYIDPAAVDLVKPTDKIFNLTSNASVLEKPNRWAKKLSEVHKGHDVHVVGIALNYMKIRMKSGLEGFIPITALE